MAPGGDDKLLISVELPSPSARQWDVPAVADVLGVQTEDLDGEFGVVPLDPDRNLFAIMVSAGCIEQVSGRDGAKIAGPYANPKIAAFGPDDEDG